MFETLFITKLFNGEFVQHMDYFLEIIKSKNPEHLKVVELMNKMEPKYEVMSSIYKPERGSDLTPKIQAADDRRDAAINGITAALEAFCYHYDPAIKNAALSLMDDLSTFGRGIARLNYQQETITIGSIVKKWEKSPDSVIALKQLNLYEWVKEMDATNQIFRDYFLTRMNENADNPEVRFIEVRKEITHLYRLMINQLEVFASINDDEVYKETVNRINELTGNYNALVIARQNSDDDSEENGNTEISNEN